MWQSVPIEHLQEHFLDSAISYAFYLIFLFFEKKEGVIGPNWPATYGKFFYQSKSQSSEMCQYSKLRASAWTIAADSRLIHL